MGFFQTSGILNRRGFFGGAAKAFSPTDIAGLQLWLDATTGLFDATSGGSAVTTDGSAVARWEDQSGNGNHVTQPTSANRPLLKTSIQNSKNVLRFDGGGNKIGSRLVANFTTIAQPITRFIVFNIFSSGRPGQTGQNVLIDSFNNTAAFLYDGESAGGTWTTSFGSTATMGSATRGSFLLFTFIANGSSSKYLINGGTSSTVSSGTNGQAGVSVGNIRGNANPVANGYGLYGDMAEILIYNSALTDTQIDSVRDYLKTKWSLY